VEVEEIDYKKGGYNPPPKNNELPNAPTPTPPPKIYGLNGLKVSKLESWKKNDKT